MILAIDKDINVLGDGASIVDNGDGTYTHTDGQGNVTVVDTRADSNPVTDAGDFYDGDNVEDILQEIPNLGCSVITQTAHGLTVGQMATFTDEYGLAMTDTALNLPVGMVTEVLSVNSFRMCYEGKIRGAHGLTPDKDYFLQDDGTYDTIPDTDIQVFGFRTIGTGERIFDVPEYISSGSTGSGGDDWGNQVVVSDATLTGDGTSGSPLSVVHDRDWVTSSGGIPTDVTDNIYTEGFVAIGSIPRPHNLFVSLAGGGNDVRFGDSNKENDLNFVKDIGGVWVKNGNDFASNYAAIKFVGSAGSTAPTNGSLNFYSDGTLTMQNINGFLVLSNTPDYANDAAADADGSLPTGGVYTVTAEDRTLRIKP